MERPIVEDLVKFRKRCQTACNLAERLAEGTSENREYNLENLWAQMGVLGHISNLHAPEEIRQCYGETIRYVKEVLPNEKKPRFDGFTYQGTGSIVWED